MRRRARLFVEAQNLSKRAQEKAGRSPLSKRMIDLISIDSDRANNSRLQENVLNEVFSKTTHLRRR